MNETILEVVILTQTNMFTIKFGDAELSTYEFQGERTWNHIITSIWEEDKVIIRVR